MNLRYWILLSAFLAGRSVFAVGENCSTPIVVSWGGSDYLTTGTTCGMGDDYRDTSCLQQVDPNYDHGEDVIYHFTDFDPGGYVISVISSTPGAMVGWAMGTCPVGNPCWDYAALGLDSAARYVEFYNLGVEFYLMIDNCAGCGDPPAPSCFDYTLHIYYIGPVWRNGQSCWNPAVMQEPLPGSVSVSTCASVWEDDHDWACPISSNSPDFVRIYTPSQDVRLNFDACGSNYDTKIYLYEGFDIGYGCFGDPIACSDDAPEHCGDDPDHSYLECVLLLSGHHYYLISDGSNGECGECLITISECPMVAGDGCNNAITIIGDLPQTVTGTTCGFADDYEWLCPYSSEAPDVVYEYVPPMDVSASLDLCNSDYDSKIFVYADSCRGAPIACSDYGTGFCGDELRAYLECIALTANRHYYIVIEGGYWQQCGNYSLTISVCLPERPCQSCEPANTDLGTITTDSCGGSVSGNCGWDGKWVASFSGIANAVYHWDLCSQDPCAGTATFEGADPDVVILDETCHVIGGEDGPDWCDFRPNDWQWTCPTSGTYYVAVLPWSSVENDTLNCHGIASHTFTLAYYQTPPPPPNGETCADAIPITGSIPVTVTGNTCERINDYDVECSEATDPGGRDIVHSYIPSENVAVDIGLCLSSFDTKLYVWADSCTGTPIACSDNADPCPGGEWSRSYISNLPLEAGHTYYVVADAVNEFECGDYNLTLSLHAGETCVDAPLIASLPATLSGRTNDRTNDYDVQCHQYTDINGRDEIYRYEPATDQFITLNLCESSFDPKLFVFADSCTGTPWACNDIDLTGTCSNNSRPFLGCIEVYGGHTYFIVVDGVNEWESGGYVLTLESCTPMAGDVIQTAFEVSTLPFTGTGTTVGFYDQYVEDCGGTSYSADVVYSYAPTVDVNVEVDLCRSLFQTRIYVYENSRSNLFACDNDGCPGSRAYLSPFMMYAGNTYYLVIEGDGEYAGEYELAVLEAVNGRCCRTDGNCDDFVTSRQCSYHFDHGVWTAGLTCAEPCPELPPPPAGPIDSANAPRINGCNYGISLASDCGGHLYYNNTCLDTLYTTNADGELLAQVGVTRDGWSTWFETGCWDKTRSLLWASQGYEIGLLDPASGVFTAQFETPKGAWDMEIDPVDGTLWIHEPDGVFIYQYDAAGTLLRSVIPLDTNGHPDGNLRGICLGPDNSAYLSHNNGRITRHDRTTGSYQGLFAINATWQSRAITCDALSFAPQTVIWWKFDNSMFAYVAPEGTCLCQCPPADSVTVNLNPGGTNMTINFYAPIAGSYTVFSTTHRSSNYPVNFEEAGTVEAAAGINSWTDPSLIVEYRRYVVVHVCN